MFLEIYILMNNTEKVDPQEIFALSNNYYNTTNIVLWTFRIFFYIAYILYVLLCIVFSYKCIKINSL